MIKMINLYAANVSATYTKVNLQQVDKFKPN